MAGFYTDERGSVSIMTAIVLVAVLSIMGLAIDTELWSKRKAELQELADAASVAGAKALGDAGPEEVIELTKALLLQKGAAPNAFEITINEAEKSVRVTAKAAGKQYLSIFMLPNAPDLPVMSVAVYDRSSKLCVLAMDPSANPGIVLRGNGELTGPDCAAWSNSGSPKSISVEKAINVKLRKMCAVGEAQNHSSGIVSPAPSGACNPQPDPLAGFSLQVPAGCDHTNFTSQQPVVNLSPGPYCGGVTIVSDTVIAAPGIYFIKDGDVNISGTSEVRFESATIYLSGKDLGLTVKGDSNLRISAPEDGPTKDIAVAMDPSGVPAKQSSFGGSSQIYISGAMHVPQQKLVITGDTIGTAELDNAMLIAKQIDFGGGSEWKWVATDKLPNPQSGVSVRLVK